MHVVVGNRWDVEVHDVPEGGDVDSARRDIGGHQHPVLAALEAAERLGALRLRPVAVNAFDGDAGLREVHAPGDRRGASSA